MNKLANLLERIVNSDKTLKSELAYKDFQQARKNLNKTFTEFDVIINNLNKSQLDNLNFKNKN